MTMSEKEWRHDGETTSHLHPLPTFPFSITYYSRACEKRPGINEDGIFVDKLQGFASLFDGVGGRGTGTIATRIAIQTIQNNWNSALAETRKPGMSANVSIQEYLRNLIETINTNIYAEKEKYPKAETPAGTLEKSPGATAAFVQLYQSSEHSYFMCYAHIGDCRIYVLREKNSLNRLTTDEGYLEYLLQRGVITQNDVMHIDQATSPKELSEKQKRIFRRRNKIMQALGWEEKLALQINQQSLSPGDRILLCTDGIHDNLTDSEIKLLLKHENIERVAEELVNAAVQSAHKVGYLRAKHDDMSAVVISIY